MPELIDAKGLRKSFGAFEAVRGIDLRVPAGQVLGFLGPNGAGKSTTMRMLTGFLTPSAGSVRLAGIDLAARPLEAKRTFGYLPEGAPAYGEMRVEEFLRFAAHARGFQGAAARARVDALIDQLHLGPYRRQAIETLSKGYKRRTGLAQALLHDPPILVLDEPTDGLDPNQKHEVRELIRRLGSERAVVLSTHILEEVEAVCTRAVIISQGTLVFDGTPAELEARAPAGVQRNRLDHVFRALTTGDTGARAGDGARAGEGARAAGRAAKGGRR
ncbi:MAG: ABC transporter ATP-binding protein [Phycisphaerales bacterium]